MMLCRTGCGRGASKSKRASKRRARCVISSDPVFMASDALKGISGPQSSLRWVWEVLHLPSVVFMLLKALFGECCARVKISACPFGYFRDCGEIGADRVS